MLNENIRERELRVISDSGEQLGIISKAEALKKAEDANLDLVLISPNAKPPVAKIMDYGKFRFEQQKKAQGKQEKSKDC